MGKFSEKIIFARLKKRDREAFGQLYDLYVDQIYRFVFFKVNSREESEDITSLVFLKTWNYLLENSADEYDSIKPLLYRIARTTVIDHYRQKSARPNIALEAANPGDLVDEKQDPRKQIEHDSVLAAVMEKAAYLKDEHREVIILRYANDLSVREIAKIMDKPAGTVRVQIFRAIKALREMMEK